MTEMDARDNVAVRALLALSMSEKTRNHSDQKTPLGKSPNTNLEELHQQEQTVRNSSISEGETFARKSPPQRVGLKSQRSGATGGESSAKPRKTRIEQYKESRLKRKSAIAASRNAASRMRAELCKDVQENTVEMRIVDAIDMLLETLKLLLYVQVFASPMDAISGAVPFVQMAWAMLAADDGSDQTPRSGPSSRSMFVDLAARSRLTESRLGTTAACRKSAGSLWTRIMQRHDHIVGCITVCAYEVGRALCQEIRHLGIHTVLANDSIQPPQGAEQSHIKAEPAARADSFAEAQLLAILQVRLLNAIRTTVEKTNSHYQHTWTKGHFICHTVVPPGALLQHREPTAALDSFDNVSSPASHNSSSPYSDSALGNDQMPPSLLCMVTPAMVSSAATISDATVGLLEVDTNTDLVPLSHSNNASPLPGPAPPALSPLIRSAGPLQFKAAGTTGQLLPPFMPVRACCIAAGGSPSAHTHECTHLDGSPSMRFDRSNSLETQTQRGAH